MRGSGREKYSGSTPLRRSRETSSGAATATKKMTSQLIASANWAYVMTTSPTWVRIAVTAAATIPTMPITSQGKILALALRPSPKTVRTPCR